MGDGDSARTEHHTGIRLRAGRVALVVGLCQAGLGGGLLVAPDGGVNVHVVVAVVVVLTVPLVCGILFALRDGEPGALGPRVLRAYLHIGRPEEPDPESWVEVCSGREYMMELLAGKLRAHGIEARVVDRRGTSSYSIALRVIMVPKILVRQRDREIASRVLRTVARGQ